MSETRSRGVIFISLLQQLGSDTRLIEFDCRFFKQLLLAFSMQQMAAGLFRLIAGVCRSMTIANTGGSLMVLVMVSLGGFVLPKGWAFFFFFSYF